METWGLFLCLGSMYLTYNTKTLKRRRAVFLGNSVLHYRRYSHDGCVCADKSIVSRLK